MEETYKDSETQQDINLIEITEVDVCQEKTVILEDINLNIGIGEFIYIIGKVGSGKSSLLKTLYAELPILKGEIVVNGYNLKKIKSRHIPNLRRKIGMVFQDFQLLPDRTVYENLKFVLKATGWKSKKEIDSRIDEVLHSVGMTDKKSKIPTKLSGGEQQSISIARALLNNPPLILADEPTGNLDPDSADEIMNIIYKLPHQGKSVVMVTHNYNLLKKYPGRTFMCNNNKFFELKKEEIEMVKDL